MTQEEKSQAYDEALKQATKELQTCGSLDCDAARQIFRLFPQLRESEDEKIRKELLSFIESVQHSYLCATDRREKWIAYLAKQKESLHIHETCKENADSFTDKDERIRKYLIEELKAAKSVGELKFIIQQPTREECIAYLEKQKENPEEPKIAFGDWGNKEKQEAIFTCLKYMRFIKKMTNQEYDDLIKWLNDNLTEKQKEQKPNNNFLSIEQQMEAAMIAIRGGMSSKSQEWSEEDEKKLNLVIDCIYDFYPDPVMKYKLKDWLNFLPERFTLQSKEEWGKEETKDLVHILRVLDDCYTYGRHDLSKTDHDNLTSRIKFLRPSWKPSEEQMNALLYAMSFVSPATKESVFLSEIYENLKKL